MPVGMGWEHLGLLFLLPKLLLIGDSHSTGAFGQRLFERLAATGQFSSIDGYASCGSAPSAWVRPGIQYRTRCGYAERSLGKNTIKTRRHGTPDIADLLNEKNPQVTIVQLGGNFKGYSREAVERYTVAMARDIVESGSYCIWVGPSPSRHQHRRHRGISRNDIANIMREAVQPYCAFVDSRELVSYPRRGGDRMGVHFPKEIARQWADAAFDEIYRILQSW